MTGKKIKSKITCPHCGFNKEITMPTDNCVIRYECVNCNTIIVPKKGDCCIFCSHGDVPCPPEQDVS